VGKKQSDPTTNLFSNYLLYCKEYDYKPLSFNIFSTILIQQLNVLTHLDIYKKRTEKGIIIINLKLNKDIIINNSKNNALASQQDIMEEFAGYFYKSYI
jgi:Poxvirus D5 protein-like